MFFISSAYAQSAGPQEANPMVTLVMFGGLFSVYVLFNYSPTAQAPKRAHRSG